MYLVTAYRWGWTNYSSYIVYCGPDRTKALALGNSESADRGGKYGCDVAEFDEDGTGCKSIGYYPSAYGEVEQHHNYRLDFLESLGMRAEEWVNWEKVMLPNPDKPGTLSMQEVDPAPEWFVAEAKRAQEYQDMIERIYREAREKHRTRPATAGEGEG